MASNLRAQEFKKFLEEHNLMAAYCNIMHTKVNKLFILHTAETPREEWVSSIMRYISLGDWITKWASVHKEWQCICKEQTIIRTGPVCNSIW